MLPDAPNAAVARPTVQKIESNTRAMRARAEFHPTSMLILLRCLCSKKMQQQETGPDQIPRRLRRFTISSAPRSGAEVGDRRGTADALNPDVLDPGDIGCNV